MLRLLFLAGLLASILSFPVAGHAASAAFVGDNYESISDAVVCSSISSCTMSFPAIPGSRIVRVTRVQCRVRASDTPFYLYFGPSTTAQGTPTKETFFETISSKYGDGFYYLTVQSIPEIHIAPGRFPTVFYQLGSTGSVLIRCALSGHAA